MLERGTVYSTVVPYSGVRTIVVVQEPKEDFDAASIQFDALDARCDDWNAPASLSPEDRLAPRDCWDDIAATLMPDGYGRCDVVDARLPGRAVIAATSSARPGDEWIAAQLQDSLLLRYRWDTTVREAAIDSALMRMRDGDLHEALAAAQSLAPSVPQRRLWQKRRPTPWSPAIAVRWLCVGLAAEPWNARCERLEGANGWDAEREMRGVAASMLDGPLWMLGVWPESVDRIAARIDAGSTG